MDFPIPSWLASGEEGEPFIEFLAAAADTATSVDIGVAFVTESGIRYIEEFLCRIVDGGGRVRFLSSDYLSFNDPIALQRLLQLQDRGIEVRMFETSNVAFHLKAYIFYWGAGKGTAFVGSSNLTKGALTRHLEWNVRIDSSENIDRFVEIERKFDALFCHQDTARLTASWIERYKLKLRHQPPAPYLLQITNPQKILPNPIQVEALSELQASREVGVSRGLVVMATGLGKTFLSAFDVQQMEVGRLLFVAHLDTILDQTEKTYAKIFDGKTFGRFTGKEKSIQSDFIFASIQTLGQRAHLEKFSPDTFDYIVVDEFHHASASSYRRLLDYFRPKFLLGLTATPDRTDQVSILNLCDDNEIYRKDLLDAVTLGALCPFVYYGIADRFVDYSSIKWSGGRFNDDQLEDAVLNKNRAQQAFDEWSRKRQSSTIAFCVRQKHADFMARFFAERGVRTAAVYSGSAITRQEAIHGLESGDLEIIFTVDLFNEGVDIPSVDTVLLLRPTESKIVFLQQIGRGLRKTAGKSRLHIIDFIGNHRSFLKKPEALFRLDSANASIKEHLLQVKAGKINLPPGCEVEYDLEVIDFISDWIKSRTDDLIDTYASLKERFPPKPTAAQALQGGVSFQKLRSEWGSWFGFVAHMQDLSESQYKCFMDYKSFFEEVEKTAMTRSFKIVTLEAMIELDGFRAPPTVGKLALQAHEVMLKRRKLWWDVQERFQPLNSKKPGFEREWTKYWKENPINAWVGGNGERKAETFFRIRDDYFEFSNEVSSEGVNDFHELLMELIEYRYYQYEPRIERKLGTSTILSEEVSDRVEVNFFPDLAIACGHFREGMAADSERIKISSQLGIVGKNHFVCRAMGNSMDGGKVPIRDGDFLLMEQLGSGGVSFSSDEVIAVARTNIAGGEDYLLRRVSARGNEKVLVANNPDYSDLKVDEEMRPLARFKSILPVNEVLLHKRFLREEIPSIFKLKFNTGNWNAGHVVEDNRQFLLVTLNKGTKSREHKYADFFESSRIFHWQSQNSTTQTSKRGLGIKSHQQSGVEIHLFVRRNPKKRNGKAEPFAYCGLVNFLDWKGSEPIDVKFELMEPLSDELVDEFGLFPSG